MKTSRNIRRTTTIAALIATPLLLIGCSSGQQHAGDINSIRWNPSPAMHTLAGRDAERLNMYSRMQDSNLRMIHTDVDRMFYLDRPSRLHLGIKP
ncbi:MAG: hypothetical protein P1U42_06015 [Phycisphaerales bacterium]|nr:hypothetical protein [Phycisphaerales bacterium]